MSQHNHITVESQLSELTYLIRDARRKAMKCHTMMCGVTDPELVQQGTDLAQAYEDFADQSGHLIRWVEGTLTGVA